MLLEQAQYINQFKVQIYFIISGVILVLITAPTGSPQSRKTKKILLFYVQRKSDMCLKHLIYLYKTRWNTLFGPSAIIARKTGF